MSTLAAELATLDALGQAEMVRTGAVKPLEVVKAAIGRIEAVNPTLNAVITPTFDRALDAARAQPSGPFRCALPAPRCRCRCGGTPTACRSVCTSCFGDEARLLQLAGQLERARPWADRVPAVTATD